MDLDVDVLFLLDEAVDADHRLFARLLAQRGLVGEVGDVLLEPALLDQLDGAAALLDLAQDLEDLLLVVGGQCLDVVAAAQRVDDVGDVGLLGDDLLGAQRHLHRVLGGDREGLVVAVGVQRLRAAEHGAERLQRGAHDVDLVLRLGERGGRRLAVEAQAHRVRIASAEALLHDLRVAAAQRAELGHLLEEVALADEEEGQPRREFVDRHAGLHHFLDIDDQVGQREGGLVHRRGAGFADVIAGDVDRVVALQVARAVGDDVAADPHAGRDRVDVLLLRHVLLEDVGLHGARQPVQVVAALLG